MKKNYSLRFRQIHLDFHTSECIPGVGSAFKKKEFQEALKAGHVDSITIFSKCHHGWSYHPTKVGKMHPTLKCDLMGEQMKACHEINVNAPIYLSAGLDNVAAHDHPEWRRITLEGKYAGWWSGGDTCAGFKMMCFGTPYLDYLCAQIREAVTLYPKANGVFLDIIFGWECCCTSCLDWIAKQGLDATKPEDRQKAAAYTLQKYYEETTKAARCKNPDMPVFHNSGHVGPSFRKLKPYFSHLELESLPTGGWGYDHYPLSAKHVTTFGLDYLGMTGKFHVSWGEFGGFKHPNALKYECAAMLAFGSKCSVGDQAHPTAKMDESTYALIGEAYADVERKEPWCDNVTNVADIGLMMAAATAGADRSAKEDTGAGRILLEGHFLFDIIDPACDFKKYRMIVLPDTVAIDGELKKKLAAFVAKGGKLFLTGTSGLDKDGKTFLFDVGAVCEGEAATSPDYVVPRKDLQASFVKTPLVMYQGARRIKATKGESLGAVYDSYFNRHYQHFCSHQHTPNKPKSSGYDCGVLYKNILYLAHPVFSIYADYGAVAYKDYIVAALKLLLGESSSLQVTGLPSTGRVSLLEQPGEKRCVLHALYAPLIKRGNGTEIVEDLLPVHDVAFAVNCGKKVKSVRRVPESIALPFTQDKSGTVRFALDTLLCHQMVELK